MAYLYGASVQGIQEYIFATNKLMEIIGASKLVEDVNNLIDDYSPDEVLINAAGNIKAIFKDEEKLKHTVENFLKEVKQKAYGITISQAVVKLESDEPTTKELQDKINELEQKLKIQRNIPTIPLDMHINILKQSPKTAKPAVISDKEDKFLDISSKQKRDRYAKWFQKEQKENNKIKEYKELSALANKKRKIAVIHADGNGLGTLIPHIKNIKKFSKDLDEATHRSFEEAKKGIKIRPIILGGDDMVAICDGDDAMEFTKRFLEEFEKNTKDIVQGYSLTACAGIAYAHDKFPFHYAVALAEELCSQTKKHAKKINEKLAPSSLMFHNIQSSNFQSWEKFVEDELTIKTVKDDKKEIIRCDFGPYYLDQKDQVNLSDFINTVEAYRDDNSPISRLREWLGKLGKSRNYADELLKQIYRASQQKQGWNQNIMDKNLNNLYEGLKGDALIVKKDGLLKTPVYDILQILSATAGRRS